MKVIVKTTGAFSLLTSDMQEIPRKRPAVVTPDHFIHTRTARGHLKTVAQVNDDATDAEFEKYWQDSERDEELAVAAFVSAFPVEGKPKRAPRGAKLKVEGGEGEADEAKKED